MVDLVYPIRTATVDDIPVLIDFRARLFALVWKGGGSIEEMNAYSKDYFKEKMESGEVLAWVAESESGEVVGTAMLSFYYLTPKPSNIEGKYGYLSSMYVLEEHRRKGIGRRLVRAVLDHAKEIGLQCVKLHASDHGVPLYESTGFSAWNEMGITLDD
ncbi:MAG: GNAT family N-acetyltransferase [Candidatus Latescibacteria bacterium]|jgi:ribosomal protein S18 acetylase RimI-like enzyme|nr:GNAT family N-acetyltransferase [Candidatus Latescibacterota bacterium]